ncbi:translocase of outer mitochondrial membrane [Boothiomyces macroporosus]|uniref:Translocase of outer mitochondrial membrane n=1 Tax=Boothiomyces macroporosus TaxID=261099 RepID=A0AAD5UGR5_9FUNG|nr:translocase of outer mitochondrial membrane [Boothiomyces macroporosus]
MSLLQEILDKLHAARAELQSPGTYEGLHREATGIFPVNYMIDGAKFDLTSIHSQNFQTTHSLEWGSNPQKPASYNFGAMFGTNQMALHGMVDGQGNLRARGQYNWIEQTEEQQEQKFSSISKIQAQLATNSPQSAVVLEQEITGKDYSISLKAVNANPADVPPSWAPGQPSVTGIFSASYLQSITKSIALGVEWTLQRPYPDTIEPATSFAFRYAPPPSALPLPTTLPAGSTESPYQPVNPKDPTEIFTATYVPAAGMLHSSYWRKLNQRLEVGTEIQCLLTPFSKGEPGRREAVASIGFKLDTVYATIRAAVETTGKIATVLEEKIAPGLSFQLNGEIDYAKGGAGRVGFGFTFEQ